MRTATIKVYKYDELSEKAKEKVLDYFREKDDGSIVEDSLPETLRDKLMHRHIKYGDDLELYWSLSNCQGDGFCFIGTFEWKKKYLIKIVHNSRYCHSNSVEHSITYSPGHKKEGEEAPQKSYDEWKIIYSEICSICEKDGYALLEEVASEEYIKEMIEDNEYEFTEDGRIFIEDGKMEGW